MEKLTSLKLDEDLLAAAKSKAAAEKRTLKSIIIEFLTGYTNEPKNEQ